MTDVNSTYRFQLRGDAFTLSDAGDVVDYLDDLGVSHAYLSPVLTASTGSQHGYDVTDTTTVSAELGGRDALVALVGKLKARAMGAVIDIVPNHVGVEDPRQNAWWWDVLKRGADSEYATYFDIDWRSDNGSEGRIAIPVLGEETDTQHLTVDRSGDEPMLAFYDHRFPIAPQSDSGSATDIHDRQAYRLVSWKSGLVGYRRFFSVNGLAGLRQEDPNVFDATHTQIASWAKDDLLDGIRVDHPDGLADPAGYLARLRDVIGPDRWLVIEKILAQGEPLDESLPVDGTTGYDALAQVGGVFVDPAGESALTELSRSITGDPGDHAWLSENETAMEESVARTGLAPEVARLVEVVLTESGSDVDRTTLTNAVVAVVASLPYYRSDYAPLAGTLAQVIGDVAANNSELTPGLDALAAAIVVDGEAAVRLQQVCGAVTAKGVEDCLFYRTARLVSLQEVGGEPAKFGFTPAEFHLANADRAVRWPSAMTTLSTHDTKRGEDVRARIGVLSQTPELWARCLADWEALTPSPDGTTALFLWQNLFGVWPVDGHVTETLRSRLHAYAEKAIREAGLRTEWNDVNESFEKSVHVWLDDVIDGPVSAAMTVLVGQLSRHGRSDALGQKLLQLTGPGIPDVYQGTELWEDSLVDPDNRRPVDYAERRRLLAALDSAAGAVPSVDESGSAKLWTVRAALTVRREHPSSFVGGTYAPVYASGAAASHLIGFSRGPKGEQPDVIALATRHSIGLDESGWGATTVELPAGKWRDRLGSGVYTGVVDASDVFDALPVALLVREQ